MSNNRITTSFLKEFGSKKDLYNRLGQNSTQAIRSFLKNEGIAFLALNYRIKESESIIEKIKRKNYQDPFNEIEDICGIRIICYYQKDIIRIINILKSEFEIFEQEKKQEHLKFNEFGYRSDHLIVGIKDTWQAAPNYRDLSGLKIEIQIRTVLMHAWAEIEHKLAYKTEDQIPEKLKRKMSRISAKLEESDEQFEEIYTSIIENKEKVLANAKKKNKFDENLEFNLDNLQAFLDFTFPVKEENRDIDLTSELFNKMSISKTTFKEYINSADLYIETIRKIEKDIIAHDGLDDTEELYNQYGKGVTLLALINEDFLNSIGEFTDDDKNIVIKNKKAHNKE